MDPQSKNTSALDTSTERPSRILRAAICFPACHTRGGVERIVLECAKFLSGRGHEVHVVAAEFGDPTGSFERHHVQLRKFPAWSVGRRFFDTATKLLRIHDEFDVVNTHGCVCPLGGVQWVHSLHAAWLERCAITRRPWTIPWIRQRLNPLHASILELENLHFRHRNYRKLTATTEVVRRDLQRFYGVPASDVELVPNGFNPVEFSPARRKAQREAVRSQLGLQPDEFVILFVANELERKGLPTLLRAVRSFEDRKVKVVVAGRRPTSVVLRYAERYGVRDQVLAVGGRQSVADLHAGADVMALPTQYEAFCLAILESLGSGLPVITTNVPGARDAIIHGVNGLLIDDPNSAEELNAALLVARGPDLLARLSAAAPASVVGHQWPTLLREYERVLVANAR